MSKRVIDFLELVKQDDTLATREWLDQYKGHVAAQIVLDALLHKDGPNTIAGLRDFLTFPERGTAPTDVEYGENIYVICRVEGNQINHQAGLAINRLASKRIRMRAVGTPKKYALEFYTHNALSENDRQAWENIIRGVCQVM